MKAYYVYMMTNKGRTALYTGVTNSLVRRVWQHREGTLPGFTSRYNVTVLVFYERFSDVRAAIAREKEIKGWNRSKKNDLVMSMNPGWDDLSVTQLGLGPAPAKKWSDGKGWRSAGKVRDPSGAKAPSG